MLLRELVEKLDAVADARKHVDECETAVMYGGNCHTMERKYNDLDFAKSQLEGLLDQPINLE